MEEKQEKKQKPELKGKMPIVWLTGILVIILGCVTVYTFKLVNENKQLKEEQPVITETKEQIQESTSKTEEQLKNTNNTTAAKDEKITSMTSDEKFTVYANGMRKIFQNLKNDGMKYIESYGEKVDTSEYIGTYSLSSGYFAKIDNKANLYINDKKVTSNVLNISKMLKAQNGSFIFAIKEDGTLEYISENDYTNSKYVSHKLEGFRNIIDVIDIQGIDYNKFLAIDIDGNSYEINL